MAASGKPRIKRPALQGTAVWLALAVLLGLGSLSTAVDFLALPEAESKRASEDRQRFVVDVGTGTILIAGEEKSGDAPTEDAPDTAALAPKDAPAPATEDTTFDVAETPAATAEDHSPAATEASPDGAAVPAPASDDASASEPASAVTLPSDTPVLRSLPSAEAIAMPARTAASLVPAPAPEVTETVDGLALPKRGEKDTLPGRLYAHPFTRTEDQVLISFVVMDVGVDLQSLGLIMQLPPEISVAYSPYTRPTNRYSEHLRAVGHEIWTMLPTMTDAYPAEDPGPMGLIARMPPEELARRTREVLAAVPGSVGVILPTNETMTLEKDGLSPSLGEINKRGLNVLSSHPSRNIDQITTNAGLARIIRRADLVLDPEPNEAQIRSRLAGIIAAAEAKGEYVVLLSARPQTLNLLSEWLKKSALEAPLTLAPLSAIYLPRVAPEPAAPADDGHGKKPEKKKAKPVEKKQKPLPQDKYLKPAAPEGKKSGGH
jgi:polysaccharide deacetylase 2 family uncharacterized protein YibQ